MGFDGKVAVVTGASTCDVSVRSEVDAMFKITVDEFEEVDVLVNNAGIAVMAPLHARHQHS